MKMKISVPSELFAQAKRYAEQHNLTRSEMYVTAIQLYIEAHPEVATTTDYTPDTAERHPTLPSSSTSGS